MRNRKYLPTFAELIDRLSIAQIKECKIPEHKSEYAAEILNLMHDIQSIIDEESIPNTSELIRLVIILSQMNLHIWHNEANYRKGIRDGNNLELTHGLNGLRNISKNRIQDLIPGDDGSKKRKDYKVDCLASEFKDWEVSW